ncbi:pleckstrin homology domain-containing family G member 1 isoform X1 [Rissa tridactyla]|uniref:pleckstrin homology domain-containing family G member 1 isoform X1 n=2 Tax=Rissa tridactyla TaxID=75485 RepID=UPI0023BAD469|nr:pleckstrin homology domain-containing family G member 1 isoform X1 [Rissa tridactyla]XP_054050386.1 pleckstrin homology domain-containing family G member 1 isoform X1 [Rissa tridactyla]XP_054050387.1 pleckstrin homology domain-containing family G member 1 isoform X1 [Rissa tridactyla]XP_054050388.1 pleckstrin homology domain-containing family G member 1 isoform X1 [Rissa tridactyla]XP_054050389.1 pleckstrin homology domain-containing family G member 1 isoform X1 [Rissa tridactyla]XP_0540503
MPDKTPGGTEPVPRSEDGFHLPLDVLPAVTEALDSKTKGEDLHKDSRPFRYCEKKTMDLSDSDRPVSFSSTSSSASSRDSHCSFGSRMTLVSNSHLGLFNQDKETGAIKLELVPARRFSSNKPRKNSPVEQEDPEEGLEKRLSMPRKAEAKGASKNCAMSLVTETTSPKLLYVDRVVQEILETERMYVQDLKSIVKDYLDCITDQTKLSLGTEERSALFGNIRDIYRFNSELLQDLENCENDPVAIADCFVSKSEDFHIYTQYCTNYPRSVAALTECMRNKTLAKFFRERQEALQHSLPLGSYLLKPVQRILKYHLLLHEIENHLDKDTEGYDVVLDAIDTMQRVAWHINDMKRKHEHAVRLQEIQSLLTNWKGPDLTSYGELVLEGTFRIQRAKNERTLFLFDKLLLITKKRDEMFVYKAHILCGNLMLVEVIPKEPLSFSVFHYKNPKMQHTVQAKSQQDKRLWILHLKRLILENHPAKIPAKAKQAILEMDAIHHPGFHYSPEGEMKSPYQPKEGSAPNRVRRKSEPSSRVHKVLKSNDISPDMQKRISIEGALLSQATKLGSNEALLNSRKKASLEPSGLESQFQESIEPAYSSDQDENLQTSATEQIDADDEEESEQGVQQNSLQKSKGGRKRLNSQAAENVEKRRSVNLNKCETQSSKDPSDEESTQLNTDLPFSCAARQAQLPRQFSTPQSNSLIMNILGGSTSVRNIWTDHQIRQALFPSRRPPYENEDDEDDYQMFVPSMSTSSASSAVSGERRGSSGRPCSWHLGVVHQNETSSPTRHKIVRRASSAGESNTCPASARYKIGERSSRREAKRAEVSSMNAYPESSEELTIDDIEHVYDNISYEDLKLMGLTRREETDRGPQRSARDSLYEAENKSSLDSPSKKRTANQNRASIRASRDEILLSREAPTSSLDELRIVEDNIYDTIVLPETPLLNFKCDSLKCSKRRSFLGLEKDFACCDNLRQFVSEESLQFSEDESPYHRVPVDNDYLSLVDSSSNSDSLSHKSAADKLSEEVDEIWNDLENYIKKNEEKTRDRLLAAFPVCKDDMQERLHAGSTPELSKDVEYSLSTLSLPETPIFPKTVKPRAATLGEANLRLEDTTPCKENSFMSLNRSSFSSEMPFVDSPYESANSVLSNAHADGMENDLAVVDKTKNRVFMMARQYSQKIKKANQLLKVKSPEQEQPASRQQKLKHKDLAAILEEKKQGGPAIGARIAEYSQLYDQIVFRESSPKIQKEAWATPQEPSAGRFSTPMAVSPPRSQAASECSRAEDWLLHSTYSNGELADFSPWPESQYPKSKSSYTEAGTKSNSRQLPSAGSVPSLQISNRLHVPAQRWSAIISQPNKENLHQDHIYNSLGRRVSNVKPQAYSRSQSSSSIVVNRSGEAIVYPNETDKKKLHSNRNFRFNSHQMPGIASGCTGPDTRKQIPENCSDMILQDSQKVLRVNRASPLTAQMATQNYFSNFKDTEEGEGDDDDDYVEIKSEDEGSDLETSQNQTRKLDPKLRNADAAPSETLCGKTVSCTPAKPASSKHALTPYLTAYSDSDKLNDYLWRVPSPNQQNIVQSLREKFQCLSSSSFA